MTDRSPEDELIAEARKFGYAMKEMLRLHAQAGNWLERRRIRKQINLELRQQRRSEQADRNNQLVWTQQMIDRYRAHSVAVADRGGDPSVDHERRYRDSQALARHADDLRTRIVTNGRLTKVEQGIALDGLDAATIFPQFEPGRLFDRAHKVRGLDALRYRAQVARTVREQANSPRVEQQRTQPSYEASLTWTDRDGQTAGQDARGFGNPRDGLAWMYRDIDHTMWVDGQIVNASLRDPAGRVVYRRDGNPELVAEQLEHPLGIIRTADGAYRQKPDAGIFADPDALADHQRTVADAYAEQLHPAAERPPQQQGNPFEVLVGPTELVGLADREYPRIPYRDRPRRMSFATRAEAYDWTLHQLDTYRDTSSVGGEEFFARIGNGGRDRTEFAQGPLGMVTDEVRALREQHLRPQRGQATEQPKTRPAEQQSAKSVDPDRFAQIERQLSDISDDRDRLENRVGMLQRGLDAVTADRDEMKRKLDAAEGRIEELKNRNIRLANEIGELRDRPKVDQVTAERDRYKRERDEAVQKLAQATPEHERYGSPEHRAAEERRNGRPDERSGGPDFHAWRAWKQQQLAEQAAAEARRQEMAEAFGDSRAFAEHLRSIDPDQTRFTTPQLRADEFMRWWDEDSGAEKHQRERSSRETTDRAAGQRLDDTQPWRPIDVDHPEHIERNGQRRNGIERSR